MSKPFFLTRQTANLMEDFEREFKTGSSVLLLYGDTGVGKTRLLEELSRTRLVDGQHHWLDISPDESDEKTEKDDNTEIEKVFKAAGKGDVIIVDDYENAAKRDRHQLLVSWAKEGADYGINLVIGSDPRGYAELSRLSQQYQVPISSFQLMPFNADEVDAFLGFYLFPSQPAGKLSIATPLRKQLTATQGMVAELIEIADRERDQFHITPLIESRSSRPGSRFLNPILVLLVLAVGGGWYLSDDADKIDTLTLTTASSETTTATETLIAAADPTITEAEQKIADRPSTSAGAQTEPSELPATGVASETSEPVFDNAEASPQTITPTIAAADTEPELADSERTAEPAESATTTAAVTSSSEPAPTAASSNQLDQTQVLTAANDNPAAGAVPVEQTPLADAAQVEQAPLADAAPVEQSPLASAAQIVQTPPASAAQVEQSLPADATPVEQTPPASEAETPSVAPESQLAAVTPSDTVATPANEPIDTVISLVAADPLVPTAEAEPPKSPTEPAPQPATAQSETTVAAAPTQTNTTTAVATTAESNRNPPSTQDSVQNSTLLVDQAWAPETSSERLQRELRFSLDWINQRESSVGTVQILLLSAKSFDANAYFEYVDSLAAQRIDIDLLRIFKTFTAGAPTYSVVYSEFKTRKQALKELRKLPKAIRKASPIARSVGGLLEEIERMEAKS